MGRNRHLRKRLWRLRSNPLRRHDDIVEAWIVLVVWAVVLVDTGQKAGSEVVLWVDSAGDFTTEPVSSEEATLESAVLGLTAALAFAGPAFGTGAVARYRLDRRRIDSWGTEWNLVGPSWGRRTS